MRQNGAYRVVIRNLHYSIPVEEIKELRRQGHTVRNIVTRYRVHKHPLSMFYVDLEPQHNNKDIYNLQYLRNMKIIVEPPNKNRTIIQCTRCQLYGHSKSYCTRPYKCVKCGGNHMTTDCQKSRHTGQMCPVFRGPYRQLLGLYSLQRSNKSSSHTDCQAPRSAKHRATCPARTKPSASYAD